MDLVFAPSEIETWPIDRLRPYARNAKMHGDDQVAKIAASMARFGWTVPCMVADDGELIAGHGRVLAATMLGLTDVPVIRLGHLDEAERRAYRIADNKLTELGEWDEGVRLLAGEGLPSLDGHIDIGRVQFHPVANAPRGLGRDQRGAISHEGLINRLTGAGVVQDWPAHALHGFLRAVHRVGVLIAVGDPERVLSCIAQPALRLDLCRPSPCAVAQAGKHRQFDERRFPLPLHFGTQTEPVEGPVRLHSIPSGEDEAAGAVFAVVADFLFLEDAEGFRGVVGTLHIGGVEDVAQLVAGQAVGAGVEGVEIGAQVGAAILIPGEGRAVMAQIAGEGGEAVRCVVSSSPAFASLLALA